MYLFMKEIIEFLERYLCTLGSVPCEEKNKVITKLLLPLIYNWTIGYNIYAFCLIS